MLTYFQAAVLGLVQGLTEFLPVSSSGHLAIFKELLGATFENPSLTYEILLHLATLVAVFVAYYKDIWQLIVSFFTLIRDIFTRRVNLSENPGQRLLVMLIVATIPAGIVGFLLDDFIESVFGTHLIFTGIMLIITSFLLLLSDRVPEGKIDEKNIRVRDAIIPGLFQAAAIVPGLSRSGSTITGGLFAGLSREFCVKFSFLLSIPVILGAGLVDIIGLMNTPDPTLTLGPAALGMFIAAVVGFLSIKFMLKLVTGNKFHYFAYYCLIVGLAVVIWQIIV